MFGTWRGMIERAALEAKTRECDDTLMEPVKA
jgi:hypothetical protein